MALLNKAQFAARIGRASNYLSTYIGRGEVVIHSGEGKQALIEDTHPVNQRFLIKRGAKDMAKGKRVDPKSEIYDAVVIEVGGKKKVTSNGKDANDVLMKNLALLEQEKAELGVQKQREELEKIKLYNEKARGELLPSLLFKPLLARNNQHFTTTFKNLAEELISDMTKKKNFSAEERATVTQILLNGINRAIEEAHGMSIKSLDSIIDDFKNGL